MRLTPRFLASLVLWSFFAGVARAATEIPCTVSGGLIWLQVQLAGQSAPLDFLLDSGAGKSVLDLRAARRLGVALGAGETVQGVKGRCTAWRVESFVGWVASVPVPGKMLALDLSSVSAGCGRRVDGLLGADFFREHIVQINIAAQKVRLLSRAELAACPGQTVPLARRNDALCVRLEVDGNTPQWMRLDTGYSGALEWVTARVKTRPLATTSLATAAASGTTIRTDVRLGEERISGVRTGLHTRPIFSGESGLVGNGLLSPFVVTVDAAKSRLLLHRPTR